MKQGWEIKKLGEVCDIINGFAFKSNLFTDEGEYILRISNIQNGYIDLTDIAHFNKTDYPKVNLEKYAVLEDDIVVALSGATTGKFGINKTGQKLYLNQRVAICRENTSKLNHLYLLFYLRMQAKSFLESAEGVAQPNLSTELMKQIPIPVPPLPVQEQIVAKLDLLSSITEKKREQLKELDALAQSIFYDMFGDPITNEKGWEVKKLGEVCESVSYGTSNSSTENGEYKYLRMNNITYSGHIDITDIKYIDVSDDEYEKYVVRKGDILFNRTNSKDLVGKTALFNFEEEMIIAGYIIRVRVNQDSIIPTFVVKWLNTPLMKSYFKNICKGAVNQSNINSKELKNIPISIPPLPLQHQFATKIEAIEKQKELIKQSISETETLFNERMQEHFG